MLQTDIDSLALIKCMYGLEDYTLPENSKLKAILFFPSSEEKEVLKKNNIYFLEADCRKDDILNAFNEKVLTEEYIALHTSDVQIIPIFEKFNIPGIFITVNPNTQKVFEMSSLSIGTSIVGLSSSSTEKLKEIFITKLNTYKSIYLMPNVILTSIDENFIFNEENIKSLLETNYTAENVFYEDYKEISQAIDNYARYRN